jgi:ABC-type multidrug transport system ATPase subunit
VTPAVSVSSLTKRYGEIEAVRGIDLEVAAGETFGFLGPNGAGKSTTIKILCTLADPDSGSARVAGYDVTSERGTVRRNIGLVFQDTTLDSYLTGEQNLRSMPTCTACLRRRSRRGCARCWRWSGSGSAGAARCLPTRAGCSGGWR